ncbi:MAG TPA: SURF1 family protein [Gemmatimonadales bacterium]|jgi:surfeit locus 1 family protein
MSLRRRDVIAALFALAVAALCVRLGIWQLARLEVRRARNAEILAARNQPPLELRGRTVTVDEAHDRRIHARGIYDWTHERVWPGRTWDGAPGVALLTPLRLPDSSVVFVDRGFAPSPDARRVNHAAWRESDTADVVGLGFAAPRDRGDVNPAALADSFPYPVLPFVVQLVPDSRVTGPTPLRWRARAPDNGPHLSYAIQWFSFAVIVLVGTTLLLRTQMAEAKGVRKTT